MAYNEMIININSMGKPVGSSVSLPTLPCLSIQPVTPEEWRTILAMGGMTDQ